jgi:hypothetical protein
VCVVPTRASSSVDRAVRRAREVVGLYGDPDVTWSIVLSLATTTPQAPATVQDRLEELLAEHPHLGTAGRVREHAERAEVVDAFADTPYGDRDPLVRAALTDAGRTLTVAAHHGCIDGLGLVGLAGRLLALPLGSTATGVRRTGAEPGFLRGSLARLGEAAFRPPERFRSTARPATGDWLLAAEVATRRPATAALVWAAHEALAEWNGRRSRGRQPVVAIGVSRRSGTPPLAPDRDTAYTRLHTTGLAGTAQTRDRLALTDPEPDFPETDGGGVAPVVVRLLSGRLGASVLVSNLGRLTGDAGALRSAAFWPTATGPGGVGLGLVSAASSTTLTLRARRAWFARAEAERLLGLVCGRLEESAQ